MGFHFVEIDDNGEAKGPTKKVLEAKSLGYKK